METYFYESLIEMALKEDMPYGDLTTDAIFTGREKGEAQLVAKEPGILAGSMIFRRVFETFGPMEVVWMKSEGDFLEKGELIARVKGSLSHLLKGERTALNFIQRLSGISTKTKSYVDLLEGSKTQLLDTRKTTPGYRCLEKYAVRLGGGVNHRFGLSDGILVKDNHITGVGSITCAVNKIRALYGGRHPIEVEIKNLEELKEALNCKVEMLLFDNMDQDVMEEGLSMVPTTTKTECSGNIRRSELIAYREMGFDYISSGYLTYGAKALDLSLNIF